MSNPTLTVFAWCLSVGLIPVVLARAESDPAAPPQDSERKPATEHTSNLVKSEIKALLPSYSAGKAASAIKAPESASTNFSPEPPAEVIELPKLVVSASRIHPTLTPQDCFSTTGLQLLLRKRYPGATFRGQDPNHSHFLNYGTLMLQDDERLDHVAELTQISDALNAAGDVLGSSDLKKEIEHSFLRSFDWKTEEMDRSVNHWR